MIYVLAQFKTEVPPVSDVFKEQRDIAIGIRESVESVQLDLLQSPVYHWASLVGMFFIGVFLAFRAIKAFKEMARHKNPYPLGGVVVQFVLIMGLVFNAGGGSNLGALSYTTGQWLSRLSEVPISLTSNHLGISNIVGQSGTKSAVEAIREQGKTECLELERGNERDQCLVEVIDAVEEALTPFITLGGGETEAGRGWAQQFFRDTQSDFFQYFENPNVYTTKDFGDRSYKGISSIVSIAIMGWLFLVGSLFTFLIGIVQTAMLIVAPILAGLSFLTIFGDSLVHWTRNYLSLFLGKLVFNLLATIAAYSNLQPNATDPIFFPTVMALISLAFSYGLLKGAGPELLAAGARTVVGTAFLATSAKNLFRKKS